jgi:tetratricopeptide (TPR) repeat protein
MVMVESVLGWIVALSGALSLKPVWARCVIVPIAALLAVTVPSSQRAAAQPVVQPLPGPEAMRLNEALVRLARDPGDANALTDAGEAALALGDFEAAEGFFRRAGEAQPGNARALAGLAGALVLGGDPYSAIPMFEDAEKAGVNALSVAPQRGLAYDLVGANSLAQDYYRKVLAGDTSGEIRRRLAISLAIGGDPGAAEDMLLPLLRQQDKPAWRTRAFVLAISGRVKEAVDVTNTLLPADLAQNIVPYLRYMPQLTAAQQAAAANLGKFPRASKVGRDDPRVARFASLAQPRPKVATVDAALVPKGEVLGSKKRTSKRSEETARSEEASGRKSGSRKDARKEAEKIAQADVARIAPPDLKPTRETSGVVQPVVKTTLEPAAKPEPKPAPASTPSPKPAPVPVPRAAPVEPAAVAAAPAAPASPVFAPPVSLPVPEPASVSEPVSASGTAMAVAAPGFDLAALPGASKPNAAPPPQQPVREAAAEVEPPQPEAKQEPGFSELFSDLGKPVRKAALAAGAVDISKIEPAKPKPKPKPEPAKPPPPSHPSRIWVQLGVGQNIAALKYDWRKLNRTQASLFKGQKAYVSDYGRTNRMLVGPFASRKAADAFLASLAKAGMNDPYLWLSPAGQVVEPLPD